MDRVGKKVRGVVLFLQRSVVSCNFPHGRKNDCTEHYPYLHRVILRNFSHKLYHKLVISCENRKRSSGPTSGTIVWPEKSPRVVGRSSWGRSSLICFFRRRFFFRLQGWLRRGYGLPYGDQDAQRVLVHEWRVGTGRVCSLSGQMQNSSWRVR